MQTWCIVIHKYSRYQPYSETSVYAPVKLAAVTNKCSVSAPLQKPWWFLDHYVPGNITMAESLGMVHSMAAITANRSLQSHFEPMTSGEFNLLTNYSTFFRLSGWTFRRNLRSNPIYEGFRMYLLQALLKRSLTSHFHHFWWRDLG